MSDKLREAAQAVLKSTKSLSVCCEDFNHRRQDFHDDGKCPPWRRYNEALAALESALAEPSTKESLTVAEPSIKKALTIAEQEPIAWYHNDFGVLEFSRHERVGWSPLYTAPPRKEWVGLTNEERDSIIDRGIGFNSCCGGEGSYARAVEALLREKNGG